MGHRFQFGHALSPSTRALRPACVLLPVAFLLVALTSAARAQDSRTQPIGRIEGADVTVDGAMPASVATANSPASIYVSNGSIVTVHSGKARLALLNGGEIDICGPAKFTMLTSGSDITLALNFGRVHVQLPAHSSLKIFSPTIIATPIDINGGSRDVTIGLDINDSLCVLATSGAIQLEHQFSGEKLIVPQTGEFFLNGGALVPIAGKAGNCGCAPMAEHSAPRPPVAIPEFARAETSDPTVPPPAEPKQPLPPPTQPAGPTAVPAVQPGAVFIIPVNSNEDHPLANPQRESAGEAPQVVSGVRADVTPMLAFMASTPPAPSQAQSEMMLLVSEVRESPDWQFDGHVDAPDFAQAMQQALGQRPASAPGAGSPRSPVQLAKRKRGFWAALKGLFFGKVEADDSLKRGVH
jgi:hypothetical protein